jgi:creatinine amidohydrolase/Fe(II)-dependent formamide hydrolase-like protein
MRSSDLCGARYDALDRRTPIILPVARWVGRGEGVPLGLEGQLLDHVLGRLTGPVIALPVMPFAASPENIGIPGSISLPVGVSQAAVLSILSTLAHDRFERVVVLSASPVVGDWLRPAILEFRGNHPNVAVALTSLVDLANQTEPESTLIRLAAGQSLVKSMPRVSALKPTTTAGMPSYLVPLISELAPDGYLANPEDATANDDGQDMETIVSNLNQFLENFAGPIVFAEN